MIIYLEKKAKNYKITEHIISKFNPRIIEISHYKDIFNRTHQNFNFQKNQNRIILAKKEKDFLYKGSKFCDNRGYNNFYYSTQILGCIYNCEYCYLGGLYPCGYPVIFVNEDDFINESSKLNHSFIAISYETDLLAFEGIYPFHKKWIELAENNQSLLIESRTKSANTFKLPYNPPNNFLLTFSISPNNVTKFELKAPSLEKRVKAIKDALKKGYKIEIAIDPIIKTDNFKEDYKELIEYLKENLDLKRVSISVGSFRINSDFLKKLRKIHFSEVVYYPFEIKNKEARYSNEKELIEYVSNLIAKAL